MERYSTVRVRVHRVIETHPPVPLDDRVLYPVCQTRGAGGSVWERRRSCLDEEGFTYRREVFILPVPSR